LDKSSKTTLGSGKRQAFFVDHLNRIYCAKSHLAERLPEIYEEAGFADLKQAIKETIHTIENQIARMDEIFELLNLRYSFENCNSLITFLEKTFSDLQQQFGDHELRDLLIVTYLYQQESVEMASFRILQIAAASIPEPRIAQLLKESYEEAKAERVLLIVLTKKYIKSY
jgi:ferritin-like metal-binding protein YciE